MIPSSLIYLGVMLAVIAVWFVAMKRPVYEAVLISFLLLLTITGTWGNVWVYIEDALSTSLLYSMVAFVAMSIILTKTHCKSHIGSDHRETDYTISRHLLAPRMGSKTPQLPEAGHRANHLLIAEHSTLARQQPADTDRRIGVNDTSCKILGNTVVAVFNLI